MKILMLGWEFPPYFTGGLGIACYELTKSLCKIENIDIAYIMPYGPKEERKNSKLKVKSAYIPGMRVDSSIKVKGVRTLIVAYDSFMSYSQKYKDTIRIETKDAKNKNIKDLYGENILEEVYLYAQRVATLCKDDDFEVVHAHDWTSIPAALLLKQITGKPIVLHVHIAVSNLVKNRLIYDYNVDPSKIRVVHNGGISDLKLSLEKYYNIKKNEKIVLFAGRITLQKGPEYFVRAARKVLDYEPNTKFLIAGTGDLLPKMIELSANLNLNKNMLFFGFYNRKQADELFSTADCFVMPSVSEPFGLVPLEAIAKGTPTVISKQSGISEVLDHCFKVDFWDIDEMAHKIIALLRYNPLHSHLREEAHNNFHKFNWDIPAAKIINVYKEALFR